MKVVVVADYTDPVGDLRGRVALDIGTLVPICLNLNGL